MGCREGCRLIPGSRGCCRAPHKVGRKRTTFRIWVQVGPAVSLPATSGHQQRLCVQAAGQPVSPDAARALGAVLWGSPTGLPPDSWKQGFFFCRKPGLQFGLVQVRLP